MLLWKMGSTQKQGKPMANAAHSASAEAALPSVTHTAEDVEWPRAAKTLDGVSYVIRPIRADDPERHRLFLASPANSLRYDRMMGMLQQSSADLLKRLVHVDYRHEMAIAAVVGKGADESVVAVACYCGNPAYCEFAVAVADEWKSKGVGTSVTELLFSHAKAHGVRRVYTTILAADAPMLKLASALRMSLRHSLDGSAVVEAWRSL
jgi:acetyltransferase